MTDAQRASLDPASEEYRLRYFGPWPPLPPQVLTWFCFDRVLGSKIQLGGWSIYSVLLWSLKASLLIFYRRLTAGVGETYRLRINIGFGILAVSFVVIVTNLYLACRPFHGYFQVNPDPGNVCQPAVSNQIVWVYLTFNVFTDLYLLSIPLPMLWHSSLKPYKKAGLMLIFSGGLLVVACAILRCAMIFTVGSLTPQRHFFIRVADQRSQDPVNGAQLAGSWAVRETFIAVVVSNLPMVFPLFVIWLGPMITSLRSTLRSRSGQKLSGDEPSREIRTFGAGSSKRRGPPTVYNITTINATMNESEERIVELQDAKGWGSSTEPPSDAEAGRNGIRQQVEVTVEREEAGPHNTRRPPPLW